MRLHFFFLFFFCTIATAADIPPASYFIANEGQWEAPFAFRYDGAGGSYFVTSDGLTIDLRQYERSAATEEPERMPWDRHLSRPELVRGHVVKVKYLNGNPTPEIKGEDRLPHYSNYFLGSDSCRWRSFVGHYRRVTAKNVWAGVDVEYRIEPEGIESVYHLAAGVDPSVIQVQYDGLTAPIRTDGQGNLVLQTSLGQIREKAPYACQIWQGKREEVSVAYEIISGNTIRLACSGYDRNIGMVIDPLLYSSYLGGEFGDHVYKIDIVPNGNVIFGGYTSSPDFPITPGAYQQHLIQLSGAGFVTELTPDGDSLIFSTYIGGQRGYVSLTSLAVCPDGSIWTAGDVTASGTSPIWPLTPDALDTIPGMDNEGFFTHLSVDGSALLYSSYFGGNRYDVVMDIAIDTEGRVIAVGSTYSNDFPVTFDAYALNWEEGYDGFLCVFNPAQNRYDYSTYIPGNYTEQITKIAVISESDIWINGGSSSSNFPVTDNALQPLNASGGGPSGEFNDGVFMKWNLISNQLIYSSYLGGTEPEWAYDLYQLDSSRIIIVGGTRSADFPITSGVLDTALSSNRDWDGFISIIQLPDSIIRSSYLGESQGDIITDVNADSAGITIVGYTESYDFPTTPGAFDTAFNSNGQPSTEYNDIFISRLNLNLSHLEYSTFLGGWHQEEHCTVHFLGGDTIWLTGLTGSDDFPLTENALQTQYLGWGDVFLTKFAIPDSISPVAVRPNLIPGDINLNIYPNPFNSTAQIAYSLPATQRVTLRLYDILGREAAVLLNERQTAGEHRVSFNGNILSSGVYFCRIEAEKVAKTQKIVLMR
ncbi:T9SS C-terminal target domain-containing protein [candidate division KSB1 bacterium]|nr:MAG: T9SS C-terminal target domain-containing protein [candidate division KSB1 bacterium]